MSDDFIVEVVSNLSVCMVALPVVILGIWLSTKRWLFYPIAVVGFIWMTYVVSGLVSELWVTSGVSTFIKITAWTIPPIFFVGQNIGAMFFIQSMRRQATVKCVVVEESNG